MKNPKTMLLKLVAISSLLFAGTSHAVPVVIQGVVLPATSTAFNAAMGVIKQTITDGGTKVSGYGVVTTINGTNEDAFCPDCQLTFQYGDIMRQPSGLFSGGYVKLYVAMRTVNIADIGDPGKFTMDNTDDGSLFLSLNVNAPFAGINAGSGLASLLQLDVVESGTSPQANSYFNTNGRPGGADLSLNISSTIQPGDGPNIFSIGSGNLFGATSATVPPTGVPEPGSLALLGLGVLGLLTNRKRKSKSA